MFHKKEKCGRKRKNYSENLTKMRNVPLNRRGSICSLACNARMQENDFGKRNSGKKSKFSKVYMHKIIYKQQDNPKPHFSDDDKDILAEGSKMVGPFDSNNNHFIVPILLC